MTTSSTTASQRVRASPPEPLTLHGALALAADRLSAFMYGSSGVSAQSKCWRYQPAGKVWLDGALENRIFLAFAPRRPAPSLWFRNAD
jgi:hypothetical protein